MSLVNNLFNMLSINGDNDKLTKNGMLTKKALILNELINFSPSKMSVKSIEEKSSMQFIDRRFKSHNDDNNISIDELINIIQNERVGIVYSQIAGSGKTKIFEIIIEKFKQHPTFSSFYINLGSCLENLKRNDLNFNEKFSLKFLLNLCDREKFKEISNEGKILILFDGFDEIAPYYKSEIVNLFQAILKTTNYSLWISTRSLLVGELEYELHARSFELMPFSYNDTKNYLDGILSELNYDKSRFENMLKNFFQLESELNQPLVLRMIEEILFDRHANEHLTENTNLIQIIVKRKIEFELSKPALIFMLKLAIKTIFGDYFFLDESRTDKLNRDELLKTNLVTYSCCERDDYEFVHRSFAEYFIAEFIIKSVSTFKSYFPTLENEPKLLKFLLNEVLNGRNNEKYSKIYECVKSNIKDDKVKARVDLYGESSMRKEAIEAISFQELVNSYNNQLNVKIQILKITKIPTLDDVLNLFTKENFHQFLTLNSNVSTLIFEHYESSNLDNESVINNLAISPVLIISFECVCDKTNNLYYFNNGKYEKVETTHGMTNEKFVQRLKNYFDINLIFTALKSKIIGSYHGKLDQIKINSQSLFNQKRLIDYALENRDEVCIKFLQLFHSSDVKLENLKFQTVLEVAAEFGSEKEFNLLLNSKENWKILTSYRDRQEKNLLMITAKSGNCDAIEHLLTFNFDIDQKVNNRIAADYAFEKGHFKALSLLLNANSKFPCLFDKTFFEFDDKSLPFKNFLEICELMHSSIVKDDKHVISNLCKSYPHLKYFYNASNESAAMSAIKNQKFDIYQLLLGNKLSIALHENFSHQTDENVSRNLRDLHLNYKNNIFNEYIAKLITKSFIFETVKQSERDSFMHQITNTYIELSQMFEIRKIMQYISRMDNFEIIFDFNRSSVNYLDPTVKELTTGMTSTSKILIAAKELKNENYKMHVLATFSREMCHLAVQKLFNNNCNPYDDKDIEQKLKFYAITKFCLDNCEKETCMKNLFQINDSEKWHKKLIALVPHMVVLYHGNETKLNYLRQIYKDLFEFYDDLILNRIQNELKNNSCSPISFNEN